MPPRRRVLLSHTKWRCLTMHQLKQAEPGRNTLPPTRYEDQLIHLQGRFSVRKSPTESPGAATRFRTIKNHPVRVGQAHDEALQHGCTLGTPRPELGEGRIREADVLKPAVESAPTREAW